MSEKSLKTPSYTRRAIKEYENKLVKKSVTFDKENDKALLKMLTEDKKPFVQIVKTALKQHYNLN